MNTIDCSTMRYSLECIKPSAIACLLIAILGFTSCDKQEVTAEPVEELFSIKYGFINASSERLHGVIFSPSTYYPKIKKANKISQTYTDVAGKDTLTILMDEQSTIVKSAGYQGCVKKMELEVWTKLYNSKVYNYYVSNWVTDLDTIKTKNDAQSFFVWPRDTLKAHKTGHRYIKPD